MVKRQGQKPKSAVGKHNRVFAGHPGKLYLNVGEVTPKEQWSRLLKTMRDPKLPKSISRAAEKKLAELIPWQAGQIREMKKRLAEKKPKKMNTLYLLALKVAEAKEADLNVTNALYMGAKETSIHMQDLLAKVKKLKNERNMLLEKLNAEKRKKLRDQQKP